VLGKIYRRSLALACDAAIFVFAFALAYLIRFEGNPPYGAWRQLALLLPYLTLGRLACNHLFGVYRISWRFVSMRDIPRIALSIVVVSVLLLGLRFGLPVGYESARVPLSVIAVEGLLGFLGILGVRVARRSFVERRHSLELPEGMELKPILLIGAGNAGYVIAREIRSRPEIGLRVVGFVDDDPAKHGQTIHGVTVLGSTASIPSITKRHAIERVIITIAGISAGDMRRILAVCDSAAIAKVQIVPSIHEIVDGTVSVSRIRDVEVEDLLGREPVLLDTEEIGRFLRNGLVMVTGAGGSIGSEMCRQVCRFDPEVLVLVDRGENSLFEIERELRALHPEMHIVPCVADICDEHRMEQIFTQTNPRVVIHAAAYKHVPLMEENAGEAVKNNVFGTRTLADMAHRHSVQAFVMISTDKAVNATSIMGATKRLAEMHVQALSRRSRTRFITVRFGNVLGSVGSVVPIFKKQIANGGPVTITHPDMQRYFMTVSEASQLVLQAASMGGGGEIFVLDMGEPVRVTTLAEQLIKLSGLRPYEDIEIIYTGIRPGEKLFEEIALREEAASKTRHSKIFIGKFHSASEHEIHEVLTTLERVTHAGDSVSVRATLMEFVGRDRLAERAVEVADRQAAAPGPVLRLSRPTASG
jgi:FlaA1/EpsC-like NDP-sugar epimerase